MKKLVLNSFIFLFFIIVFSNCKNNRVLNWTGKGLIKAKGKYKTNDGFVIIVNNKDGLISYKVNNSVGKTVVVSKRKISSYQKWYLYWDNKILWVYSSDIGPSYWNLNKNNIKECVITDNNPEFLKLLPKKIKDDFLE